MENNKNKSNNFWALLAMFLLGVVTGFMFAPIKKGAVIGSHNGTTYNVKPDECCCNEDDFIDDSEMEGIPF